MSEVTPTSVKRRRLDLSENVKLIIGAEQNEVTVHKSVLTQSSDFFKACCDGHDWKERSTKTVELPEEDLETVSAYIEWLYYGELTITEDPLPEDWHSVEREERGKIARPAWVRSFRSWVFADKMGDDAFTNAVVDCFSTVTNTLWLRPDSADFAKTYSELPSSSPVRTLLRDIALSCETAEELEGNKEELSQDFTFDMMVCLLRNQGKPKAKFPKLEDRCKYHIHNDKVPECK